MRVEKRIKDFERLGFGMFVHFGRYSYLQKGEWAKDCLSLSDERYDELTDKFLPEKDWAEKLVCSAKNAGCKYITLTTRHHDGFSMYDTCGLSDYDSTHLIGRDLVSEFVAACNRFAITPFFYHTLIDWHEKSCREDFNAYLKYLRASVELLCTRYGKIGGIWFDGMWGKPSADWQEDELYATIRAHQPDAIIINNTGLDSRGALGHRELDSVTFERGKPQPINAAGSDKYIASEMCQAMNDHWGWAKNDFTVKSVPDLIEDLCACRKFGANYLLNVGPMPNGYISPLEDAMLEKLGQWVALYEECLRSPRPTGIVIENQPDNFILADGNDYYLFCFGLPSHANLGADIRVNFDNTFAFDRKISSVRWLDSGEDVPFSQSDGKVTVTTDKYRYGENYVVRVAKIML